MDRLIIQKYFWEINVKLLLLLLFLDILHNIKSDISCALFIIGYLKCFFKPEHDK